MNLRMRQNSAHHNYTHSHAHNTMAKMKRTTSIVGNWNSWYSQMAVSFKLVQPLCKASRIQLSWYLLQLMTQRFHSWAFYPVEMSTYTHQKTWTRMFTAALFVIASNWKYSNADTQKMIKLWQIYKMRYCSTMRLNEPHLHRMEQVVLRHHANW